MGTNSYRKQHMEQYAEYQRQRRRRYPKETLLLQAKSKAKTKGLDFSITMTDLIWPDVCPVLGTKLDYNEVLPGHRKHRTSFPSLDRRDNTKGYVPGNVSVISHRANRLKSDASLAELEAIVAYAKGDLGA